MLAGARLWTSLVTALVLQRLAIACLTGSAHLLAGLCLLAGLRVRAATIAEAIMMSSFVVLLHLPAVFAAPGDRLQLTMLGMAMLLTCAAWLVATWPALPGAWALSRRAPASAAD